MCPSPVPKGAGWDEILKEVPLSMRVKITLACTECKQRNYDTMKNKRTIRTVWK